MKALIAALSLVCGLVYVVLIPPFQSPDESSHFLRAWQVSEGRLWPEKTDRRLGGELPASLSGLCDSFLYLRLSASARAEPARVCRLLEMPLRPGERRFTDFANTAIYAPSAYLPQALTLVLLRSAGATPLQSLYGIRVVNLLLWFSLLLATLRLLPFMRGTVAAFGLLPATLVFAASANPDVLTTGLCWWLTAAFVGPRVHFWKKAIASVLAVVHKVIVLPLVLPGLLKGQPKQRALLWLAGVSLVALLWSLAARELFIPYDAYNPQFRDTQTLNSGVDPARQLAFVCQHPVQFIGIATKSGIRALPSLAAHLVGKFGWEKNYIPVAWTGLLWACLLALLFSENNPLRARTRGLLAGVAVLYTGAFALTMYALWCAAGAPEVHNWQGRYFIVLLPAAALATGNGVWKNRRKWIERAGILVLTAAHIVMIHSILLRYWQG